MHVNGEPGPLTSYENPCNTKFVWQKRKYIAECCDIIVLPRVLHGQARIIWWSFEAGC